MSVIAQRLREGIDPTDIPEAERAMDAGADLIERLNGVQKTFQAIADETVASNGRLRAEIVRLKAAFDFVRRGVVTYSVVELDEHFRKARAELEGKP